MWQKILRGGGKRAFGRRKKYITVNIIKEITIQKTSGGQNCCQGASPSGPLI